MRIGIDMLADQSAGRNRGTGRYVRGLLPELLRGSSHDLVLYYYDNLPRTELPDRSVVRNLPAGDSLHRAAERLARENPDRLDLLLLTCPLENFQGYLPPFPSRRGPKLAALVYDLIPWRFPGEYLRHPAIAHAYRRALAALRHYDLLLTLSESGRQDLIALLHASPDRVANIGAGSDAGFFAPAVSPSPQSASCLARYGITQPFIYAMTALDYRKNFSGLLAAFDRLPQRIVDAYQFVVTCASSSQDDADCARELIGRSHIGKRIVLTHSLDDVELCTLYQHAAAFVFPSRYEGFGLPLVEAMQCGTPVIAGRNSSQIEVVGNAGLLADVEDADELAKCIRRILDSPQLAAELRERGLDQARRFTWKAVAERCAEALMVAARSPRHGTPLDVFASRAKLAIGNRLRRLTRYAA